MPFRSTASSSSVIALAVAVEENQDSLFQSLARLKSATHLMILLMRLWQKLNAEQTAGGHTGTGLGRNSGCYHCPSVENLPVKEFQGAGFEPQQTTEHNQRHEQVEETYHLAL